MASEKPLNWSEMGPYFADEDNARAMLEQMRWHGHPACPHCGGADPYKITPNAGSTTRKGLYKCKACRKQFTVTVGTIFEDSHVPITKWLQALFLITASKKGISAHQIHRMLGVTYKTAWFMMHRFRFAMSQEPLAAKLSGIVEVDETYLGKKGTHQSRWHNKVAVVGLIERGGKLRTRTMERVTAENIGAVMHELVDRDARLMTDESGIYQSTFKEFPKHEQVVHSKKEYARGDVTTNTIEGFFGILKRGITGVYQHVGKGNVNRYVDEFAFRYNARKVSDGARAQLLVAGTEGKRLTYRQPAATV
jgi:transposase-like protein